MTAETYDRFDALWADARDQREFPAVRPLLAHYTSIAALERIMATDELWLSNPLYMSDFEELRFGINEGTSAFHDSEAVKGACGSDVRHQRLLRDFDRYFQDFERDHALDTYVLCFSEHDPSNTDGMLSMWRGYGGNGSGAALVLGTGELEDLADSPLILAPVFYASVEQRLEWVDSKLLQLAQLMKQAELPDDQLYVSEEREWRVVYLSQRDGGKKLHHMRHYSVGPRGVEPKLKLKVQPIAGVTGPNLSLSKVVKQIILGPTLSSPLAERSVHRMLESIGKGALISKVIASTTPFRPT
jgi:hypothetical protein